ncbi:MAG: hypothetical protein EBS86_17865, partial [Crocinitomicaceae bacterium]|nr:hypothetical protein [Crocinitomicaceae bacterium]
MAFPFQPGANGYLIPPFLGIQDCVSRRFVVEGFFRDEEEEPQEPALSKVHFDSEEDYRNKVSHALESIHSGMFDKVVLSRSFAREFSKQEIAGFL